MPTKITATVANGESVPKAAGFADYVTIEGLKPNTPYYFALRIADEVGNYSDLATTSGTTAIGEWSISVVEDTTNNIGFYSSVAFDKSGTPQPSIAYSDETADDVKFARWDGTAWNIQTVDTGSVIVRTGISLAYDPLNNPTISYGWGALLFAQWVPATQGWQITVVDNSSSATNDVTSLVHKPDGNASISYRTATRKGGSLKFARKTAAGWTLQTVAAAAARYSSLAYDSAGNPTIAYSDVTNGGDFLDTLKFARWDGTSWSVQTIETGTIGFGVMASLAYDDAGNPAIAHSAGGTVRFVRWNGASWDPAEIVANGTHCSLKFHPSKAKFYISYSDESGLRLAKRDVTGWTNELIESSFTRVRWITSLAISPSGVPAISYSTSPNNDAKFAIKAVPPGP